MQRQLNRQGQRHIANLAYILHQLWSTMMEDLKLPEGSSFVDEDYLKTSKYHQCYERALTQYWQAKADYAAGGYVGLTLRTLKIEY